jgi:hypothetical protein
MIRMRSQAVSSTIKRLPDGLTEEAAVMETLFHIVNKKSSEIPFKLNSTQLELDLHLTGRDLVPKARQEGVSFYFLYRYLAACLCKRNVRAVIISHDRESTGRLLNRIKFAIESMEGPKPVIKNMSANEITFPKTNSMIYIGTAGSRKFGRGDTITHLHCSEYAFWEHGLDLLLGLLQACPRGHSEIAIESTGNGAGNDYHKRCMRAASGGSQWTLHFFNWLDFPEYCCQLSEEEAEDLLANLDPQLEEPALSGILTPGQLLWRRDALEEIDYDLPKFRQEYPITLEECFQASGHSLFTRVLYSQGWPAWQVVDSHLQALESHPRKGCVYSLGADVAAGVGKDRSVIEVICVTTQEQVAEWVNDRIEPDFFATKIEALGRYYNEAFVTVESNNHGIVTLDVLMDSYPMGLLYSSGTLSGDGGRDLEPSLVRQGFKTSPRSKPLLIGKLRKYLAKTITIYSSGLKGELDSFIEKPTGAIEAEEGCFDDRVIAMGCAVWGIERASLIINGEFQSVSDPADDPFSTDYIIASLESKRSRSIIREQHSVTDSFKVPQHRG